MSSYFLLKVTWYINVYILGYWYHVRFAWYDGLPLLHIGYGKSRSGQVNDPVKFMTSLLSSLDIAAPVIISPSMSGSVALPFLTAHPDKVKGYIPVAPVSTGRYTSLYPSIKVRML